MTDEIKEILNQLEKVKDGVGTFIGIDNKGAKLLLDCITNLQQERDKFKLRNEKARNHIMAYYYTDLYDDTLTAFEDELLNILQGDDKNVKD